MTLSNITYKYNKHQGDVSEIIIATTHLISEPSSENRDLYM